MEIHSEWVRLTVLADLLNLGYDEFGLVHTNSAETAEKKGFPNVCLRLWMIVRLSPVAFCRNKRRVSAHSDSGAGLLSPMCAGRLVVQV